MIRREHEGLFDLITLSLETKVKPGLSRPAVSLIMVSYVVKIQFTTGHRFRVDRIIPTFDALRPKELFHLYGNCIGPLLFHTLHTSGTILPPRTKFRGIF